MAGTSEIVLSDIEPGPVMAQQVLRRMRMDFSWRIQSMENNGFTSGTSGNSGNASGIGDTSFDRAAELFEAWTTGPDGDSNIPRVNLIHKAIEDFLSVAITNIPNAHVKGDKFIGIQVDPWERPIRLEILNMAIEAINLYVKSIKGTNNYDDLIQRAVTHAAIFGVGYVYTEVDKSLDTRQSFQVRDLVNLDRELTESELGLLEQLTRRIALKSVDPRNIYWRHSVRDFRDEDMLRVSVVEQMDTSALREIWKDSEFLKDPSLIRSGTLPFFINEENSYFFGSGGSDSTTAMITMYELEPVMMERVVETEDGEETFGYNDWMMHKITMAGDQLVDYENWTSEDGPMRLPIIPVYLRKSVNHPYGWSLALMLERSEDYINAVQTLIFKSALRAVSSQGVAVAVPNMGEDDLEELEYVLEEGGVARITGNNVQGPIDIRDMVMPLNFTQAPVNPALVQAMNMQMNMFSTQSQEADAGAIASARSGAAKRAQIAIADRPKTISINMMNEGVEDIIDNLIELIRIHHSDQIAVTVDVPGGNREQVVLNQDYQRNVLIQDEDEVSIENPLGIRSVNFEAKLNSTSINMWAESDGRSELPLDLVSRYQLGVALVQTGAIQPETLREMVLSASDELKAFDDRVVERQKREQLKQQLLMLELQAAQQAQATPLVGNLGGVTTLDGAATTGIAREDIQSDIDNDPSSVFATNSNPLSV